MQKTKTDEDQLHIINIINNSNTKNKSESYIYNKYNNLVLNKTKSFGYDLDMSKDITIEIMSKVFLNLHKYDFSKGKFKSWLLRVTNNYLIDISRKNKNSIKYVSYTSSCGSTKESYSFTNGTYECSDEMLKYYSPSTTGTLEEDYIYSETWKTVMTKLNDEESNLFKLKFVYGYDNEHIGEMYKVDKNVVSNKINYLKRKILKTTEIF